ncbi:hypothetical protein LB452_09980 [Psychroflexus sp. CAK8W]|uniref:Uncharacterized protein n=1 Tax=Psychroflexus longus TaxID=2873596 RepID=A0ABS7XLA7_9FLAO|nr:hypothetical protein [Psychroflexus longus]MBZ9779253.1 hypothetical protein [Psychroflexus longus]
MKNSYLKRIAMILIFHEDVYSLVLRLDLKQSKFIYILKINIMKKFFSIIALGAMTMSLSSFTNLKEDSNTLLNANCTQLAMDVHDSWTNQGYTDHFASGRADAAYDSCVSHSGTSGTEVTISQ